jgi:hypothetical protein
MIIMNEIASIISTVGFPIASFLISAYFIKYSYDKQLEKDKQSDEREDRHWEEISKLTAAVNNNTEVLRDFVKQTMQGGEKNE